VTNHFEAEVITAREAQHQWSQWPISRRLQLVRRLRQQLVEQRQKLWQAVAADVGRGVSEVIGSELLPAASACRFLERQASRLLAPQRLRWRDRPLWLGLGRDVVYRRPRGVVAVIGTWNYPLFLNFVPIVQALTAGNAVVWKPSEHAPRTAIALAQLFYDAGFPSQLLQVLPATREAGPLLLEANIDLVLFTGSEAVGQQIARRLGERLIPSILELSGCDPLWVLADSDVALAARAAWFGTVTNRGQTCIAVRRIFVHRTVAEQFRQELTKLLSTAYGYPSYQLQLPEQHQRYWQLREDALRCGAEILMIPTAASATDCPPAFLWNVSNDAAVLHESYFAPLAAVVLFDDLEQALALARRCRFGLGAAVFSHNTAQAERLAALLPAGQVCINDVLAPAAHPATPFGGRGASGWGVTQGSEGLLALTIPQVVSVRYGQFRPHYDELIQPTANTAELLEGLLRCSYGGRWSERWRGWWQMLRCWRRR
jgi:aldehyde dehydrogenase (NAD+)